MVATVMSAPRRKAPWSLVLGLLLPSCMSQFEARHESQGDSREQIWMSEESQVKLRAAQSRVFDTTDKTRILTAVVATLQDLGFMIAVVDEDLGIVSGTRFDPSEGEPWLDPSYHLYDDQELLLFTKTRRSWGPFHHRTDLVRVTVTVRKRNEAQSVVRASAQFYLRAVEDPEPYQRFFRALEQSLFLQAQLLPAEPAVGKG